MSSYDLIPAAMLAVAVVVIVATLIGRQKAASRAMIALLALFVLGLWHQEPTPPELAHLHPFPVSLFVLLVTLPVIAVAALLGWTVRALRSARSRRHAERSPPAYAGTFAALGRSIVSIEPAARLMQLTFA